MDGAEAIPSFGKTLALAVGLAFVLEGLFYAVFAQRLPKMLESVTQMPEDTIRRVGIIVATLGLVWMVCIRFYWH